MTSRHDIPPFSDNIDGARHTPSDYLRTPFSMSEKSMQLIRGVGSDILFEIDANLKRIDWGGHPRYANYPGFTSEMVEMVFDENEREAGAQVETLRNAKHHTNHILHMFLEQVRDARVDGEGYSTTRRRQAICNALVRSHEHAVGHSQINTESGFRSLADILGRLAREDDQKVDERDEKNLTLDYADMFFDRYFAYGQGEAAIVDLAQLLARANSLPQLPAVDRLDGYEVWTPLEIDSDTLVECIEKTHSEVHKAGICDIGEVEIRDQDIQFIFTNPLPLIDMNNVKNMSINAIREELSGVLKSNELTNVAGAIVILKRKIGTLTHETGTVEIIEQYEVLVPDDSIGWDIRQMVDLGVGEVSADSIKNAKELIKNSLVDGKIEVLPQSYRVYAANIAGKTA